MIQSGILGGNVIVPRRPYSKKHQDMEFLRLDEKYLIMIDRMDGDRMLDQWLALMANLSEDPNDNTYLELKARADAMREDGLSESDICEELALHLECEVLG